MSLLVPVAVFVAGIVVYAVRDRLARRRRRRMRDSGRPYECRAMLAMGDQRPRRGRLLLAWNAGGELRWRGRRAGAVVDLADARVLSATVEPAERRARPGDVLLRLHLAGGIPVRIVLPEGDAAVLIRRLSGDGAPAAGVSSPEAGPPPAAGPARALPDLPELAEEDLTPPAGEPAAARLARFAPYAVRQLPAHGWEDPRRPAGSAARSTRRQVAWALGPPLLALVILGLLTAPWPYRWFVLHTHPTAVAAGTSTGEQQVDGPGPVPADVTVRFRTAAGADSRADVATNRDLPAGTPVSVRYAVDDPAWARLESPGDGLDRGAGLAAAGGGLGLGWLAWRLGSLLIGNRAVRRALSSRRRPALALLTADPGGDPVLLVCDPVIVPVRLLAVPLLGPLPQGAAAAFPADAALAVTARGRLAEGEPVVAELPGPGPRLLLPAAPAVETDPELLGELLDSARTLARFVEEEDRPADRDG